MDNLNIVSDFELFEMFELFLNLYGLYLSYMAMEKSKNKRRWWVRPLNQDRDTSQASYFNTFLKMKSIDPEEFFCQTRMTRNVYDLLLTLLEEDLTKKSLRPSIEPECRLAITLCYLSQGVSPKFLAWSFRMGRTTIRKIVLETCETIWNVLSPIYVTTPIHADYKTISEEFWQKWNMPNCIGAIDGKHINIQAPPRSGSNFFNYKKTFSIVLMASCDANYIFTDIAVGAYGSQSDGGIFRETTFGKLLLDGSLNIPQPGLLPNSNIIFPHYFVGDAAFPLKKHLLRPYPGKLLPKEKEIFNYRLSRARRIIENSFGILVARFKILKQTMNLFPKNAEKVVLASIALHNFIKLNDSAQKYCPPKYSDWEDSNHVLHLGLWRQESEPLLNAQLGSNNASRAAFALRDTLKQYFMNEGSVPFQYKK